MSNKIAVFDLDGTLVHTAPDLLDALNHSLSFAGLQPMRAEGFGRELGSGGRAMIESAHHAQNRPLSPDGLEDIYTRFLDHYAANIPGKSQPFPGVLKALDALHDDGFLLAVCTNKPERMALNLIEGLGLSDRFGAICGADTFAYSKPDPRHLLDTIAKAQGDRERSVMVGDSRTDIDTAKAAGIPVIAVDFGYTDRHVSFFDPSVVISHFDELTVDLVQRLIDAGNPPLRP